MKTLRFRFFSVSTKIIIVYTSIIAVFTVAFLASYYLSMLDIDKRLTKVNEEYFSNKVSYIERTFKDIKNNAYELRNYMTVRKGVDLNDPLEKFDQMSRLSRLINYYDYLDDVFIYNAAEGNFISALGTMDINVYFRMSYYEDKLTGKWKQLSQSNKDMVINVTKYPEYGLYDRKDFYKRLLFVDVDHLGNSDYIVGFIINIEKVLRNENNRNADINNFFVIKNDDGKALQNFLYNTLEYKAKNNKFHDDGTVSLLKINNNYVYYQYDNSKDLIYLNAVNMDQYYNRLGYFNVLPVVFTALMLVLVIVVASSFLGKFHRNLKSIRSLIEGEFVKSVLDKQAGNDFMNDVKDFIGLRGIKQINVMMLSAYLKSVHAEEIETHGYDKAYSKLLHNCGINFKSFRFNKLNTIYIIEAKSLKNLPAITKDLQELLDENSNADKEMNMNIFISGMYHDQDGIEKAIDEVIYLSESVPVNLCNKVILLEKDAGGDYKYLPDEFKNMVRNLLACNDKQNVLNLISDIIGNNIQNGISGRNFKIVLSNINSILLEAIFEKFIENYEDAVKAINKINTLVREVGAESVILLYEELISKINVLSPPNDHKGKNKLLQCFVSYIEENFAGNIYLETMADYFKLSPKYVSSKFKEITGENFTDYLKNYRITVAKDLLKNTQQKINVISEKVGYNNVNVFIRHFKSVEGITPKAYREII